MEQEWQLLSLNMKPPSHKDINKLGILPDDIVIQEPITFEEIGTEKDLQYQEATNFLTSQTVLANVN